MIHIYIDLFMVSIITVGSELVLPTCQLILLDLDLFPDRFTLLANLLDILLISPFISLHDGFDLLVIDAHHIMRLRIVQI